MADQDQYPVPAKTLAARLDALGNLIQPVVQKCKTAGREIIAPKFRELKLQLAYWQDNHPEKVWLGSLVSAALLYASLFGGSKPDTQPTDTSQQAAAVLVVDAKESILDLGSITTVNPLDGGSPLPASDRPNISVSGREASHWPLVIPRTATTSSLPVSEPQSSAVVALPRAVSVEHLAPSQPDEAGPPPPKTTTVPASDRPQQPAELAQPDEPVLSAVAEPMVDEPPPQTVPQSTPSLNMEIVNRQLASQPDDKPPPVISEPAVSQQSAPVVQPVKQPSVQATSGPPAVSPPYSLTAEQQSWLTDGGISEADWGYVDYIFTKESYWRWRLWSEVDEASYGLCQANLMVHKVPAAYMHDPVAQVRWCNWYAHYRYGGWRQAYEAWLRQNWW